MPHRAHLPHRAHARSIVILKSVVLFKRGAIADKTTFNKWLDEKLEDSPVPNLGLLVYPEGHRSIKSKPLPLKRGMVYYAHSRELPIQVCLLSSSCVHLPILFCLATSLSQGAWEWLPTYIRAHCD